MNFRLLCDWEQASGFDAKQAEEMRLERGRRLTVSLWRRGRFSTALRPNHRPGRAAESSPEFSVKTILIL
jgi:hypothetical protein